MSPKMKVKKGDLVHMIKGKDRGKQGRVLDSRPAERRVIVENLNTVKRHTRPKPMRDSSRMGGTQMTPGGVIEKAAPVPGLVVLAVKSGSVQARSRVRECKRDRRRAAR